MNRPNIKPISFTCQCHLPKSAVEIANHVLDVSRWAEFDGYGPLPGIEAAVFELRTDSVAGSRIRVQNRDGSSHVEEIVDWDLPRRFQLRLSGFSPPLAQLASHFDESWEFTSADGGSQVERTLQLYPQSRYAWPALWLISFLLKGAISKHLRQIREEDGTGGPLRPGKPN